jgi:glycosyltransferase involved in cell wall biosynthesis
LSEAIECFLRQDYPVDRRELIILDDAGQYPNQSGAGWELISVPRRFRTLAEKSNALAALASRDADIYVVWDDDDIYLPWHISSSVAALQNSAWSLPSRILTWNDGVLKKQRTRGLFHSAWAFSRDAFLSVGGYSPQEGADQDFGRKLRRAGITPSNPCESHAQPSVIYRWNYGANVWHVSQQEGFYEKLDSFQLSQTRIETIEPAWTKDWEAQATTYLQSS